MNQHYAPTSVRLDSQSQNTSSWKLGTEKVNPVHISFSLPFPLAPPAPRPILHGSGSSSVLFEDEALERGVSAGRDRMCLIRARRKMNVLIKSRSRIGVSFSLVDRYSDEIAMS